MKREFMGFALGFIVVFGATQLFENKSPTADVFNPLQGLMTAISPAAKADEPTAGSGSSTTTDAFPNLVKINDQDYTITVDASVSTTPSSSATVRKIGYGNVTQVRIVTTASGSYSTDGLASSNVLYPGVKVTQVSGKGSAGDHMVALTQDGLWFALPINPAKSFVHFGKTQGGGRYITSSDSTCVLGTSFAGCS